MKIIGIVLIIIICSILTIIGITSLIKKIPITTAIEHILAPGYSTCGKCKRPWKYVHGHITNYTVANGMFPLCETCWIELETPSRRLPYYREVWLSWHQWGHEVEAEWEDIETAVLNGG